MFVEDTDISAKGLIKSKIDEKALYSRVYSEDKEHLKNLEKLSNSTKINLLYAGCGADVFYPLLFVEKLFPQLKNATLQFVDVDDSLGLIKTLLNDIGVSFEDIGNGIKFYWKDVLCELKFHCKNIISELDLFEFDVYFERKFRIMKEQDFTYEKRVFDKLAVGGVVISDSGFIGRGLQEHPVSNELSSYKEMIIGIKK